MDEVKDSHITLLAAMQSKLEKSKNAKQRDATQSKGKRYIAKRNARQCKQNSKAEPRNAMQHNAKQGETKQWKAKLNATRSKAEPHITSQSKGRQDKRIKSEEGNAT